MAWPHSDIISLVLAVATVCYLAVTFGILLATRKSNAIARKAADEANASTTAALEETRRSNQLTQRSVYYCILCCVLCRDVFHNC